MVQVQFKRLYTPQLPYIQSAQIIERNLTCGLLLTWSKQVVPHYLNFAQMPPPTLGCFEPVLLSIGRARNNIHILGV